MSILLIIVISLCESIIESKPNSDVGTNKKKMGQYKPILQTGITINDSIREVTRNCILKSGQLSSYRNISSALKTNKKSTMESGDRKIYLKQVIDAVKSFASPSLAQPWDNVGLLCEPVQKLPIQKVLLTNDLTEDVMEEALSTGTNLIISYHPPIFKPLTKITMSTWKERIIAQCLANNIAIYSPHTSWDVLPGGLNDWLADAFEYDRIRPITVQKTDDGVSRYTLIVEIHGEKSIKELIDDESTRKHIRCLSLTTNANRTVSEFKLECSEDVLRKIMPGIKSNNDVLYAFANPCYKDVKVADSVSGIGRICKLKNPITISEAVQRLKKHLNIPHLQLALARKTTQDDTISSVAFVAGSGGSLLKNVFCDLLVTGEASHHEVLDFVHSGSNVVLTHHSNSERGFLLKFKDILAKRLNNDDSNVGDIEIIVSHTDTDPLKIV